MYDRGMHARFYVLVIWFVGLTLSATAIAHAKPMHAPLAEPTSIVLAFDSSLELQTDSATGTDAFWSDEHKHCVSHTSAVLPQGISLPDQSITKLSSCFSGCRLDGIKPDGLRKPPKENSQF